jgi:REP element-mobilizing transposase RayT
LWAPVHGDALGRQGDHKGRPYKEGAFGMDPVRPRRRSIRLKGYDYSEAGAYFVTICTQDRLCLVGEMGDDAMRLNDAGQMVASLWDGLPARFPGIELDAFVMMPNHVHGIIVLPDHGAATRAAPTDDINESVVGAPLVGARISLGDLVGAFKSTSTVAYIRGVEAKGWPRFGRRLWQRNYYEHVIRDEAALNRLRRYIDENPLRWAFDDENPDRML